MATQDKEDSKVAGNVFLQESGRTNTANTRQLENDNCVICLQGIVDRTILPQCSHDCHCFGCILEWIKHSNKCPLCVADIGPYIIHNVRSKHDYKRHFISPTLSPRNPDRAYLATSSVTRERRASMAAFQRSQQRRREEARRKQEEDAALAMRRYIYQNVLYAKHVASNRYTRYTPHPSPAQVTASSELQSRATAFLRRELRVWSNLDVEFLTSYIVMMIKTLDLRSEGGIKILSELLDPGIPYTEDGRHPNTEHLAHELYGFLRSPYKTVEMYDTSVQYERVAEQTSRPLGLTSQSVGIAPIRSSLSLAGDNTGVHRSRWDDRPKAKQPPSNANQGSSVDEILETRSPRDQEDHTLLEVEHAALAPNPQQCEESPLEPSKAHPPTNHISLTKQQSLLARLLAEKPSNSLDTEESSLDTNAPSSSGIQIRGAARKAKEETLRKLEERLKSQALLRVRLARERSMLASQANTDLEPNPKDAGNHQKEPYKSPTVDKADLLKEKLLRERLLLSRKLRA